MSDEKQPTYKLEVSIVAALLADASLFGVVEDILDAKKSFSDFSMRSVYQVIEKTIKEDLYPDVLSVSIKLDELGILGSIRFGEYVGDNALRELWNYGTMSKTADQNIETYAVQITEHLSKKALKELIEKTLKKMEDGASTFELLSYFDLKSGEIASFSGFSASNLKTAKTAAESVIANFKDAIEGKLRFVETGWKFWDNYTGGIYEGRVYIVAAASNDGKTALTNDLTYRLAISGVKNGKGVVQKTKVGVISLEMSVEEVTNRIVQRMTGISPLNIEKGRLTEQEQVEFKKALVEISKSPIIFDDSSELILALLKTKMRKMVAEGCKVIIIDQLEQLRIGGSGDNQAQYLVLNFITYKIKAFARELSVGVVLVHQLNRSLNSSERENRGKPVDPNLGDLAQAGEKAVDGVLIIRHDRENQRIISSFISWVKNRQGQKGKAKIVFEGSRIMFSDAEDDEESIPEFIRKGKDSAAD